MDVQTQLFLARRRIVLGIAFTLVGLALIGFFGAQVVRDYVRLQQRGLAPGTTDVEAIRGWMTLPYIARAYRVPEDALFAALNISKAGNERLSIKQIVTRYNRDPLATRQAIQQVLLRERPTPAPGGGGAP